jgi:hypothetical protein
MLISFVKQIPKTQKIVLALTALLTIATAGLAYAPAISAQDPPAVNCAANAKPADPTKPCIGAAPAKATDPALQKKCTDCGLVDKYVVPVINFLAAMVGLIVTISIVIGGIQYSASGDDPQKVAAAKHRIINAILALGGFLFLWSFLQWVVPGGFL